MAKMDMFIHSLLSTVLPQVHLDDDHKGEVGKAADESDLWTDEGGNNNGGNEPCMDEPGKCP